MGYGLPARLLTRAECPFWGHSRPGRANGKSGDVRYAPKACAGDGLGFLGTRIVDALAAGHDPCRCNRDVSNTLSFKDSGGNYKN